MNTKALPLACVAVSLGAGCPGGAMSVESPAPRATADAGGAGMTPRPPNPPPVGGPGPEECGAVTVTAPPATRFPVDIVWVVDASGSMFDEQERIAANIEAFAERITAESIDYRIVMLTERAGGDSMVCINGVCMTGSLCGMAGDDPAEGTALDGDPNYRFVRASVSSNNALGVLLRQFPRYGHFLRAESVVHFVVVTDDENAPSDSGVTRESFYDQMSSNLGRDFILHAVASEDVGGRPCGDGRGGISFGSGGLDCSAEPSASAVGRTYYELADQTGGLTASICETNWSNVFEPLSDAVVASAPLPCAYEIPPPPAGETLDLGRINVEWTPDGDSSRVIPRAPDRESCGDETAWHLDEGESTLELCPATCRQVRTQGGQVDLAIGCEAVLLI